MDKCNIFLYNHNSTKTDALWPEISMKKKDDLYNECFDDN
ncbi:hypothetical protein FH603_4305 [Spirosoma sp. LMG 31447]|uniref:Uncharacterized protein n=1 Tax=Spirosoma utsteinense TaxID=2585773 RepID=A0ABR6WC92_9BACT|nr:hypothetical protein [Spirosoma utsteinense]